MNRVFKKGPRQNDHCRQQPVADAAQILGKLVGRGDSDPGKQEQVTAIPVFEGLRQCRAPWPVGTRIRTFELMASRGRERDRAESFIGVQQHRDRQARDVGRQEEVNQRAHPTDEMRDGAARPRRSQLRGSIRRCTRCQARPRAEPTIARNPERNDPGHSGS